jgi:aryl-alcohol dehydrogenase-like predicted oxidoreductase
VSVKAAALQFVLANPVVAAVIPGASKPERIVQDHAAVKEAIPAAGVRLGDPHLKVRVVHRFAAVSKEPLGVALNYILE